VIGIGTRWSDFTTASKSVFQDPDVRFVNVNVSAFDAGKHTGLPLLGDARVALEQLSEALGGHQVDGEWERRARSESAAWAQVVARLVSAEPSEPAEPAEPPEDRAPSQAAIIGAINDAAGETGVVVNAAGSAPGDLHKLWRARDPTGKSYHVEYGYSCMGYEIPGGMGVKLAAPERDVFVLIGDGSYLMLSGELVTAVAERIPIVLVLVDNHGYASIGALSRSVGSAGFGTHYRASADGAVLDAPDGAGPAAPLVPLPVDLATNVESLGVPVTRARSIDDLRAALATAKGADGPVAIHIETDRYKGVPGFGWWDVPVAEVSDQPSVREAREAYDRDRVRQRSLIDGARD
jgi:3D-(3,5/4)-trihydroxycyclohexane-1,2-dione acylhydrolase (decyclizing)